MTWVLVLVYLYNQEPYVEKISVYESIYDCFAGFEYWEDQVAKEGTQLVCIKGDINEIRSSD